MGIVRPDGTMTWILINTQPIFSEGSTVPHSVVASFADITARRRAEDELRRQSGLMTAVLDQMGDGVIVSDTSGRLMIFNQAAYRIIGIGPLGVTADEWADRYGLFLPDATTSLSGGSSPAGASNARRVGRRSRAFRSTHGTPRRRVDQC